MICNCVKKVIHYHSKFIKQEVFMVTTHEELQVELLNQKIALLERENLRLKSENNSGVGNDESANPSKQLQMLRQHCLNLENLILFSNISTLPHVVHDFKAMTHFYLLQLAKEIEIYRFCPEERAEVLDFIQYLHSVTQEIEDMLFMLQE